MAYSLIPLSEDELRAERWRAVLGHPGYEVSDMGRVRSLDRVISVEHTHGGTTRMVQRRRRGGLLSPGTMPEGHQFVMLGRKRGALVHHLVLNAFIGPATRGQEGLHGDGNGANNRDWNLRWGTRRENVADTRRHGTLRMGENHGSSKLTEAEVIAIRGMLPTMQHKDIAPMFGVKAATITSISLGRTWKHLLETKHED